MPRKIQDFAQQSLIKPILVNVGRAGAANLDVLQVVEYVKQEAKMVYLLECLQKTPPPVIIFSENKNEVDGENLEVHSEIIFAHIVSTDIQEYLLLKGVEAVAIHGSKSIFSYLLLLPHLISLQQVRRNVNMLLNLSSLVQRT
jgi:ATP-dependent RNA helicase DDX41